MIIIVIMYLYIFISIFLGTNAFLKYLAQEKQNGQSAKLLFSAILYLVMIIISVPLLIWSFIKILGRP